MKKILILGSTGSIGTNALELIRNNREEYQVIGISGNKNIELLKKQKIYKMYFLKKGIYEAYLNMGYNVRIFNAKLYFGRRI